VPKGSPTRKARKQEAAVRRLSRELLLACNDALLARLGPQGWWPGESALEVCVGAVLTQNTAWRNVEPVIERLRGRGLIDAARLAATPEDELASLLRGAGYHNQKARTLLAFARLLAGDFGSDLAAMLGGDLRCARRRLLSVKGIGPETADSMLLYAGERPVFVIDAYTRRFLARHGLIAGSESYEQVQGLFVQALPASIALFKEFHALVVALCKGFCAARYPRCDACPLLPVLGSPENP